MNKSLLFVVVIALSAFSAEAAMIKNFQIQLKKCQAHVKALQAENKKLKADLDAAHKKIAALEAQNAALKKENQDLKSQIIILKKKIAVLEVALKKCKKHNKHVGASGERRLALLVKANNAAFQARFKKIQAKYAALLRRWNNIKNKKCVKNAKAIQHLLAKIKALILVKIWQSKHVIAALKKCLKDAQKIVAAHYAHIEKLLAQAEKQIVHAERAWKKAAYKKKVGSANE